MVSRLLLVCLCCVLATVCSSQPDTDRSKKELLQKLSLPTSDTNLQKLYNDLATLYLPVWRVRNLNVDSAFYFSRKAVYLLDSSNRNHYSVTTKSLCLLAETYLRAGNLTAGQRVFLQAIGSYHQTGDKESEAATWNTLGLVMAYIEPDISYCQHCFDNALSILTETGNLTKKIEVLLGMAEVYVRKGKSARAEKEILALLKEAKEKRAYNIADLYLYLAYLKRYEGNLADALSYALTAEKNLTQNSNGYRETDIYWELALEYDELNQPENSVYWYKKCIAVRENQKFSQYAIYRTYYLMIVQMIKTGHEKEALEILQRAEKENPPRSPTAMAILCQSRACCFIAQNRFALAEKNLLSMINFYTEELQDTEILFIAYYDISKFYVDRRQFKKAEPYLRKAFSMSESTTIARSKDLHLLMFAVDSASGNLNRAIGHFQKYKTLNDSLFNVAKNKQIEELMIKYETEKKDKNIQWLTKQSQLQLANLKSEKNTRNTALVCTGLLILLLALSYNRYKLKQRNSLQLEAQQKDIKEKNSDLQHLLHEKEWLVKEIHHRVKNNFHTVIGLLGTQSAYLKNEEAIGAMAESQQRIQAMSLIHQKLYQSETMSDIDMADYIYELVDYLKDSLNTGREILFHFQLDHISLGVYHAVPIGLILNETVTNAIKYAFPENRNGNIYISFTEDSEIENQLLLVVKDDGIGLGARFDTDSNSTMGMNLMRGLAKDIDGQFAIESTAGTVVTITFTYHRNVSKNTASKEKKHARLYEKKSIDC